MVWLTNLGTRSLIYLLLAGGKHTESGFSGQGRVRKLQLQIRTSWLRKRERELRADHDKNDLRIKWSH